MDYAKILSEKIKNKTAKVGIIGIGYVGHALGAGAADNKFNVIGLTRDPKKAERINSSKEFNYKATSDPKELNSCDIICICVPTPINEDKSPDLEPLISALETTQKNMRKGTLVIIESTIAAGTTRNIGLPILEKSGLLAEEDFFLSFSPERVDPGNPKYGIKNTPKVVAGLSEKSKELVTDFYAAFVEKVVPVSSLETAEMSKLLENTFRFINISFINEMLAYTNNLGINLWEVVDASATKPFGFMPHYPGPGIGGHCIPVDPYYLLDDARKRNINLGMVEQAGKINDEQPKKIVKKTLDLLKKHNGVKKDHSAVIVGISYKEDTDDRRESPSLKIWEMLENQNIKVDYYDPYIPEYNGNNSIDISNGDMHDKDIIVIATPHKIIDYNLLVKLNKPIIDTKNALKGFDHPLIYRI
jgi:UDP-N-acetyl-D-glucosamine dehydrogenase